MSRENGSVIGVDNTPTTTVASGVWSLSAVARAVKASIWPDLFSGTALRLDFNETTTLDSRITFTRATNGTFFNSSGVLSTATSGAARFDHRLEGGVWVNKGLLIEEQRTNVQTRSEEFNDATWFKFNATITANDETAPDGTTTADKLIVNNGQSVGYIIQSSSFTSGTTYTQSVFAKADEFSILTFLAQNNIIPTTNQTAQYDLLNGTVSVISGSPIVSIQNFGGGWYRCSMTFTAAATVSGTGVQIRIDATGNGSSGLHIWGAQLEAGAFPTSYIKTTTASVTRNADVASMTSTNFSDWYNATEGTTFWQGDVIGSSAVAKRAFEFSDGTTAERILLAAEDGNGNGFLTAVIDNDVVEASLQTPNPTTPRTPFQTYKHSFAYKVDDFAASLDGAAVQTDTSGTISTVTRLDIGFSSASTVLQLNGHIAKFYYWNTRKSNAFLQGVTS